MGGGAANLRPFHRTSPLDALRNRLGDHLDIIYETGCSIDKSAPLLSGSEITTPSGEQGFRIELFDNADWRGEPVVVSNRDTSRFTFGDEPIPGAETTAFSMRATASYTPTGDGVHEFELVQVSPSRVSVDGAVVIDGITDPPGPGTAFFGAGSYPISKSVELEAGRAYEIVVELTEPNAGIFCGLDLGVGAPVHDDSIERAASAAALADLAIVVVGTNDVWETEGEDRTSLSLPGAQDQLVAAVLAANPRTVVVLNTGAPVAMPWADRAPAILQAWFGGQEMSLALVDVLVGDTDPGGRLPTTYPVSIRHTPSFGTFPGDNGQVPYAEGVFMGYRWYDSRDIAPLFAFGHGLSYTMFDIGTPRLSVDCLDAGDGLTVEVDVTNVGRRRGSEVVQCYVRPAQSRLVRPDQELKAFDKVTLDPGESSVVTLELDGRSFAYWDPAQPEWPDVLARTAETLPQLQGIERRTEPGWTIDPGGYQIVISTSSARPIHSSTVTVR